MKVVSTASKRPPGRPVGTGPVALLRRELLADGKLDALVGKVYALAMAGDMAAARILLDRVIPPLRAQAAAVAVEVPAGSLTVQAAALVRAALSGQLAPDIASELIGAIAKAVGVEEADELRRRIDLLEEQLHGGLA